MSGQRLFVSHASEDEAAVSRIVTYLEAHGVACWIAGRDIPPSAIYADAIVEGMQSCTACLVIVSAAANASKAVKRELELASHEDKPFIPIRLDGTDPTAGLAYYLRNTQWVDYRRFGERSLDRIATNSASAPPPAQNADHHPSKRPESIRFDRRWVVGGGVLTLLSSAAVAWWVWGPARIERALADARQSGSRDALRRIVTAHPGTAAAVSAQQDLDRLPITLRIGQPSTLPGPQSASQIEVSGEQGLLAVNFGESGLATYDVERRQRLWRSGALNGYCDAIRWSPTGDRLAVVVSAMNENSFRTSAELRMLHPRTGDVLARYAHRSAIGVVRFSPDGETILIAGRDGYAAIFDRTLTRQLASFQHPGTYAPTILTAEFSPDGAYVATMDWISTVRAFRVQGGEALWTTSVPSNKAPGGSDMTPYRAHHLSFGKQSAHLVAVPHDGGPARLLDAVTGNIVRQLNDDVEADFIAPSNVHGRFALCYPYGGANAGIWNTDSSTALTLTGSASGQYGGVNNAAFDSTGDLLAISGGKIWDARNGSLIGQALPESRLIAFCGTTLIGSGDQGVSFVEVTEG